MLNFRVGVNFVHVKTANQKPNKVYITMLDIGEGVNLCARLIGERKSWTTYMYGAQVCDRRLMLFYVFNIKQFKPNKIRPQ